MFPSKLFFIALLKLHSDIVGHVQCSELGSQRTSTKTGSSKHISQVER